MPESEAVAVLNSSLEADLRAAFGTVERHPDGSFAIRRRRAVVWIRATDWADDRTLVRVFAYSNVGVGSSAGLNEYLATENGNLVFGKFSLDETAKPVVTVSHTLLGDFLSRAELEAAVMGVAATADEYDDRIKERFGG